jgi:hypothetical protein
MVLNQLLFLQEFFYAGNCRNNRASALISAAGPPPQELKLNLETMKVRNMYNILRRKLLDVFCREVQILCISVQKTLIFLRLLFY